MAEAKLQEDPAEYPNYIGATNVINTELARVKKEYGDTYKELYQREEVYSQEQFDRKNWKTTATVTIMQFNMLADGLSGVHVNETNKDAASKKKTFVNVPKECLRFEYRGFRILEEIQRNDPGIVCIEECDQFDFLLHYLTPLGFKGEFNPKSSSPCIKIAKHNNIRLKADGVAIFYKHEQYKISERQKKDDDSQADAELEIQRFGKKIENIQEPDIPAMSIVFQDIKTNKLFIVCVAHLKSIKTIDGEVIRLAQLQHLLPKMNGLSIKYGDIPLFVSLDMNTSNSHSYSVVYDSIVFPDKAIATKDDDSKPPLPEDYSRGYGGLDLTSAYYFYALPEMGKEKKSELSFSTYKKRVDGVVKYCLDYILFQKKKATVVRLLSVPDLLKINPDTLLPGFEYPSDHFAVQAVFQF